MNGVKRWCITQLNRRSSSTPCISTILIDHNLLIKCATTRRSFARFLTGHIIVISERGWVLESCCPWVWGLFRALLQEWTADFGGASLYAYSTGRDRKRFGSRSKNYPLPFIYKCASIRLKSRPAHFFSMIGLAPQSHRHYGVCLFAVPFRWEKNLFLKFEKVFIETIKRFSIKSEEHYNFWRYFQSFEFLLQANQTSSF